MGLGITSHHISSFLSFLPLSITRPRVRPRVFALVPHPRAKRRATTREFVRRLVLVLNETRARLEISFDHLLHQRVEGRRPLPAELLVRLGRVAEQKPRSHN